MKKTITDSLSRKSLFYNIFILIALFSCTKEQAPTAEDEANQNFTAKTHLNIDYGIDPEQNYDLYLPANRSSTYTKILVLLHGGGWIQGDKSDMNNYIPLLQKDHPEYAIVNLNYRLAQPGTRTAFPNQFLDVQQALEHLVSIAEANGIKPDFGLIGASAGAHIALQYDAVYDVEDQVKLVCSIVGPTNLSDPFYKNNPDFELAMQLLVDQSAYPGISDYSVAVSPALNISTTTSPTILFYGDNDPLVPLSNGTFFQEQLELVGVENNLVVFEGGHGDWDKEANKRLQLLLSEFIKIHLPI